MKIERKDEIDIKALVVMAIALLCAWFGRIDWIVAALFCMSNMTLLYRPKMESKEVIE
jgi:hypothetical protein